MYFSMNASGEGYAVNSDNPLVFTLFQFKISHQVEVQINMHSATKKLIEVLINH